MYIPNHHLADVVYEQAKKYDSRTAIRYRHDESGKWQKVSWCTFAKKVRLTSQALIEFGIGVQDNIGIYAQNMPPCFYTDFGAFGFRTLSVPILATT